MMAATVRRDKRPLRNRCRQLRNNPFLSRHQGGSVPLELVSVDTLALGRPTRCGAASVATSAVVWAGVGRQYAGLVGPPARQGRSTEPCHPWHQDNLLRREVHSIRQRSPAGRPAKLWTL
jgi:hypothetical protein